MSYYHEEQNAAGSAVPLAKQFPDDAAAFQVEPALGACCAATASGQKCQPDPTLWSSPTWQALKFSMDDPHYYSYGYYHNKAGAGGVAGPTLSSGVATEYFYADAQGDLNCDGSYSTFEMLGAVQTDGTISTGAGLFKDKEID
jgi:hypothetical protein